MKFTPRTGVWRPTTAVFACLFLGAFAEAGVYRWQDSSGVTHYGDRPPVEARELKQLKLTSYDSTGRVETVLDGDTVILADGRRVRLLGIDAPEIPHRGQPGEPLGDEARRFLKSRVEGRQVRLRYDIQHRDRYNRLLAHLSLAEDAENINALMLRKGLAYARFEWPNLKNAQIYYEKEKTARNRKRGIWALPAFRVRPMDNLEALRNRFVRLRGRLLRVEKKRRYSYLLFGDRLRVAVKNDRLDLFRKENVTLKTLSGQTLVVRGWLTTRHRAPYLELTHPFQLEEIE